jgi:hypothetical protein
MAAEWLRYLLHSDRRGSACPILHVMPSQQIGAVAPHGARGYDVLTRHTLSGQTILDRPAVHMHSITETFENLL